MPIPPVCINGFKLLLEQVLCVRENSKDYFDSPFDPDASDIHGLFNPPVQKIYQLGQE